MPNLANITIKKNDGTTDVVYTGVVPSAGDKSPAIWRCNSVGTAADQRPEVSVESAFNGPRTARRVSGSYMYPTTVVGSDGKISVSNKAVLTFSFLAPRGMPDADVNEAASQAVNLLASPLFKSMLQSGYSAT